SIVQEKMFLTFNIIIAAIEVAAISGSNRQEGRALSAILLSKPQRKLDLPKMLPTKTLIFLL
ncbi:hypothetical protein L9F63_019546, partial [Diploptera punctata]